MFYDMNAITVRDRHRKQLGNIDALAESISQIGLLHPIVIKADGTLIAGERRLAAYQRLGHTQIPVTIAEHINDIYAALQAERDENTCRKPFDPSEAVSVAKSIEPYEREAARARQGERTDLSLPGKFPGSDRSKEQQSGDKTAAAVGLSRRTLRKAQSVVAAAEAEPDLFGDLVAQMDKNGKVDRAYKELQERKRQQELAARAAEAEAIPVDDRFHVIHSAIAALDLGTGYADTIITDPPYPKEFLSVYEELAHFAAYTLKPGGSLIVMIGQSYLPEILAAMAPIIRYHWTLAYLTPGGQSAQLWQRNVNTFWKPVLWFVNGDYSGPWIGDVAKSATNDNDKRFHEWGQSESGMADVIERFTRPGDLVVDPFCGAGTTGVAALAAGRRFIGADSDAQAVIQTKARLHGAVRNAPNS